VNALRVIPAGTGLAAIAVGFDDAAGTDACAPAEFFLGDITADFMTGSLHSPTARPPFGVLPMPDLMNRSWHLFLPSAFRN
jgi:hypothetical protein